MNFAHLPNFADWPKLAVLILILVFSCQPLLAQPSLNIQLCQGVWPPYTFGVEGEQASRGLALEFVNEISRRIDTPISIHLLPWKRCLVMAREGKVDGISLLTMNEERLAFLKFTDSLISDNNLIWYRADRDLNIRWNSFADLQGLRIGLAAGFNYGDEFNDAIAKHQLKVEDTDSITNNFRKLALGRIDVFFVNLPVANDALKDEPTLRQQVTYVDRLFDKVPFFMGISKRSLVIRMLPQINRAIKDMKRDGTINQIMNKPSVTAN